MRPLRVHELDVHAFGPVHFDRHGLIVAESDQRVVGYVHAGFGPDQPVEPTRPFELDRALGTIALLVVEPGPDEFRDPRRPDPPGRALPPARAGRTSSTPAGSSRSIPSTGASTAVPRARASCPAIRSFPRRCAALGYEPVSATVFLEFNLAEAEPRDPRAVLIRRQTRARTRGGRPAGQLVGEPGPQRASPGPIPPAGPIRRRRARPRHHLGHDRVRPRRRPDPARPDRRGGLPPHRRKGYGRYLVSEVLRWAREHAVALVDVQTPSTNRPALASTSRSASRPIEQSTLYRLPAHLLDRSAGPEPAASSRSRPAAFVEPILRLDLAGGADLVFNSSRRASDFPSSRSQGLVGPLIPISSRSTNHGNCHGATNPQPARAPRGGRSGRGAGLESCTPRPTRGEPAAIARSPSAALQARSPARGCGWSGPSATWAGAPSPRSNTPRRPTPRPTSPSSRPRARARTSSAP